MDNSKIEAFVNDVLKEDLKMMEQHLNYYNAEIMEYVQLKNTVQVFSDQLLDGYKTRVDIGANMFIAAKVREPKTILVNLGKDYFLEFTLPEAQLFADSRIKQLTKIADVLREESIKKRSEIKLALLSMAEQDEQLQAVQSTT